jgi:hypothetical protein
MPETTTPRDHAQSADVDRVSAFVRDLTELSHKHKVGIAGSPVLFMLEQDDFWLSYSCNAESELTLT